MFEFAIFENSDGFFAFCDIQTEGLMPSIEFGRGDSVYQSVLFLKEENRYFLKVLITGAGVVLVVDEEDEFLFVFDE